MKSFREYLKESALLESLKKWYVLPIGPINLKTGKNKYINFFDKDQKNSICVLFKKDDSGEYKLVAGSKGSYGARGDWGDILNQNNRLLDNKPWKIIDKFKPSEEDFKIISGMINSSTINGAVFK